MTRSLLSSALLLAVLLPLSAAAGDWDRARAAFEAGDHEAAVGELVPLTEEQPDWWAGHLLLGRSLLALNRDAEGLAALERAHELAPEREDVRLILARTALDQARPERAVAVLGDGPIEGPQGAVALQLLATARLKTGDAAGALADLRGRTSSKATLVALEARAAREADDLAAAVDAGRRLVALDPDRSARRHLVADLHELATTRTDDPEHTRTLCEEAAAAAAPLLAGSPTADDLLLAGVSSTCAGDAEAAIPSLRRAWTLRPGDERALGALARAQNRAGRWQDTVDLLGPDVAATGPVSRGLALPLAVALEGVERYDEAIALYERLDLPDRLAEARRRRELADRNREIEDLERRQKELQDMLDDLESSAGTPVT